MMKKGGKEEPTFGEKKGGKARKKKRKSSKSKSRGHKKTWVNNVKNKTAVSEERLGNRKGK